MAYRDPIIGCRVEFGELFLVYRFVCYHRKSDYAMNFIGWDRTRVDGVRYLLLIALFGRTVLFTGFYVEFCFVW